MARQVKAYCTAAGKEHYLNVDRETYDMWADPASNLYRPKPLGLGGAMQCTDHDSWAFLPGSMPKQLIIPPHVKMSGNGVWTDGVYA